MVNLFVFLVYTLIFSSFVTNTMDLCGERINLPIEKIYDICLCKDLSFTDVVTFSSLSSVIHDEEYWDDLLLQKYESLPKNNKYSLARKFVDAIVKNKVDHWHEKRECFTDVCKIIGAKLGFVYYLSDQDNTIEKKLNFVYHSKPYKGNTCLAKVCRDNSSDLPIYEVYNIDDNKFFDSKEFQVLSLDTIFSYKGLRPVCEINRAKKLLAKGFFLSDKVLSYFLQEAVENNNIEDIRYLIELGADANKNSQTLPAFYQAVKKNNLPVVQYFIEEGFSVNNFHSSPFLLLLCGAAEHASLEVVDLLVKNGADVNQVNKNNYSPLYYAVKRGEINIVKYLIEQGADIKEDFILKHVSELDDKELYNYLVACSEQ